MDQNQIGRQLRVSRQTGKQAGEGKSSFAHESEITLTNLQPDWAFAKNISKKEHPHRDLSTTLPRISCRDPWR